MAKSKATVQLEQLLKRSAQPQNTTQAPDILNDSFATSMSDETAPAIMSYTNSLLSTAANRNKGLLLLNNVLDQCPSSLLLEHAASWVNLCINSPKKSENVLRFKVLAKIMDICGGVQDFDKPMIALLPKVIDACTASPSKGFNETTLECLRMCLLKYPSTCGPFKTKIEGYLTKFLTCQMPHSTVVLAGSTFHHLQQVGGSGPEGFVHRNNWSNQFTKLCSTLHKLYDKLFANVTEFTSYQEISESSFQLPDFLINCYSDCWDTTGKSCGSTSPSIGSMLKNTVVFINRMLLERYPVEKSVSVSQILDVIKRGLSVDVFQQFNESLEMTQFAEQLYAHHIDLLYLLRSLIACFKQDLMPFSFRITKVLLDCLQRTNKDYFKGNWEYQKTVYKVLNYWIIIAENKLNPNVHNKLVSHIVLEITPQTNSVVLCLADVPQKKSAKAKKKAMQNIISKSNASATKDPQRSLLIKEALCLEALNTGSTFLRHVILDVDRDIYQGLFETVTQHIINIQAGTAMHPYTNRKCQAGLYKMLASIFTQPDYCMTPFLQIGISLFVGGQNRFSNSSNDDIFLVCSQGLDSLEKLCQATCPTLYINQAVGSGYKYKKPDSEELNVSDLSNNTIQLDFDNEHEDTSDYTNAASKTTTQSGTSSMKKINIIDVQIIKQAGDINAGEARQNAVEETEEKSSDGLGEEIRKRDELKEGSRTLVESIKMEEAELETPALDVSIDIKDETISFLTIDEFLTANMAAEEPPLKRSRSVMDDDEEEAMLNSFNDVVNEY